MKHKRQMLMEKKRLDDTYSSLLDRREQKTHTSKHVLF